MCQYFDILGSGIVLASQALAVICVVISVAAWLIIYKKAGLEAKRYAVPIILWFVFGALDIVITAKGTFGNPLNEENPLTRGILVVFGFIGPAVASIVWVSLWAGLVLALNRFLKGRLIADFISLVVFYSLAIGHFFGFSSWYAPLCAVSEWSWAMLPDYPARLAGVIAIGCLAAALHFAVSRAASRPIRRASQK